MLALSQWIAPSVLTFMRLQHVVVPIMSKGVGLVLIFYQRGKMFSMWCYSATVYFCENGQEVNNSPVNEVDGNTSYAAVSAASLWYQRWTVEFYKPWCGGGISFRGGRCCFAFASHRHPQIHPTLGEPRRGKSANQGPINLASPRWNWAEQRCRILSQKWPTGLLALVAVEFFGRAHRLHTGIF